MSKRIKQGSRVSTEAWFFEGINESIPEEDRWSFQVFGEKWRDSRIYGTAVNSNGNFWEVRWDLDNELRFTNLVNLVYEDESTQKQSYPAGCSYSGIGANKNVSTADSDSSEYCSDDSLDDPSFKLNEEKGPRKKKTKKT